MKKIIMLLGMLIVLSCFVSAEENPFGDRMEDVKIITYEDVHKNDIPFGMRDGDDCISHARVQCYDDSLYWFDSCGNVEDLVEECGSERTCWRDFCCVYMHSNVQNFEFSSIAGETNIELNEVGDEMYLFVYGNVLAEEWYASGGDMYCAYGGRGKRYVEFTLTNIGEMGEYGRVHDIGNFNVRDTEELNVVTDYFGSRNGIITKKINPSPNSYCGNSDSSLLYFSGNAFAQNDMGDFISVYSLSLSYYFNNPDPYTPCNAYLRGHGFENFNSKIEDLQKAQDATKHRVELLEEWKEWANEVIKYLQSKLTSFKGFERKK